MKKKLAENTRKTLVAHLLVGSALFGFSFAHTEPIGPYVGRRTSGFFTSAMKLVKKLHNPKIVKTFNATSAVSNGALTGYLFKAIGTRKVLSFGIPALLTSTAIATRQVITSGSRPNNKKQSHLLKWPYITVTSLNCAAFFLSSKTKNFVQKHLPRISRACIVEAQKKPIYNLLKKNRGALRSTLTLIRNPKITIVLCGLSVAFEWARLGKKYLLPRFIRWYHKKA